MPALVVIDGVSNVMGITLFTTKILSIVGEGIGPITTRAKYAVAVAMLKAIQDILDGLTDEERQLLEQCDDPAKLQQQRQHALGKAGDPPPFTVVQMSFKACMRTKHRVEESLHNAGRFEGLKISGRTYVHAKSLHKAVTALRRDVLSSTNAAREICARAEAACSPDADATDLLPEIPGLPAHYANEVRKDKGKKTKKKKHSISPGFRRMVRYVRAELVPGVLHSRSVDEREDHPAVPLQSMPTEAAPGRHAEAAVMADIVQQLPSLEVLLGEDADDAEDSEDITDMGAAPPSYVQMGAEIESDKPGE